MRTVISSIAVVLCLSLGSNAAFAYNHSNHHSDRKEYKIKESKIRKNSKSTGQKEIRRTPVVHNHYKGKHHVNFRKMVSHASKGGKDVRVWRVNHDTYVVKFRKGHKYYTRYIYPERGIYGPPVLIGSNWHPNSMWAFIPPIQININL